MNSSSEFKQPAVPRVVVTRTLADTADNTDNATVNSGRGGGGEGGAGGAGGAGARELQLVAAEMLGRKTKSYIEPSS